MVELYGASLVAISIAVSAIIGSRLRISSAIFEVVAGVILGNLLGVKLESWLDFLGTYGGLVLTFLAGAEVEFHILRKKSKTQSCHWNSCIYCSTNS
jgi:glutathione-regulated potassium-efflux system ancillary protein KefC